MDVAAGLAARGGDQALIDWQHQGSPLAREVALAQAATDKSRNQPHRLPQNLQLTPPEARMSCSLNKAQISGVENVWTHTNNPFIKKARKMKIYKF